MARSSLAVALASRRGALEVTATGEPTWWSLCVVLPSLALARSVMLDAFMLSPARKDRKLTRVEPLAHGVAWVAVIGVGVNGMIWLLGR